jgi:glycosyltransferase involved in cell wall biosynthesis
MKVALVIQRYGTEVVGGSESLARQYAGMLAEHCEVDVLTTCALEHSTWANHYPAGVTMLDGVTIRRFANDFPRTIYWGRLYKMLKGPMSELAFAGSAAEKELLAGRLRRWPRALQEEVIYWQGPYPSALFAHLARERESYDLFVFFAYLFPTTYFGMQEVPASRTLFCPTLHDEPMAYLPIFREMFAQPRFTIYLSEAERRLAERFYGCNGASRVLGMALPESDADSPLPPGTPANYVLYAGRIELSKGTHTLVEYFADYKQAYPSDLRLVLIGSLGAALPQHPDVSYLGFVPEAQKQALMRRAKVFIHPSAFESFSIVLLESFMQATPALVNGDCEVMADHCRQSGAGEIYRTPGEFLANLHALLTNDHCRQVLGERGREYAMRYSYVRIARELWESVEECTRNPGAQDPQLTQVRMAESTRA